MKNRMKKLAALMLVGVALCGGVLTTQAAVSRTCGHSSTTNVVTTSPVNYKHQVVIDGKVYTCYVEATDYTVEVKCAQCGVVLAKDTTRGPEKHSVSH